MILTYSEACRDPNLFGPWFEGESWAVWRVVDKAIFGEPLTADELATFTELTGCTEPPTAPAKEVWLAFGRRAGKDVKAASLITYLATIGPELYGTRARLNRGERGIVQLVAVDRDQAEVCMEFTKSFLEQPMLKEMLRKPPTASSIELTNNVVIEITTNDKRRVRGRTVIACVLDEVAHWRAEATVNVDEDVYQSITPAMTTIPNALLIGISSPYARRGLFWNKFKENWGKPGRTLFMRAPTWVMNPILPRDHEDIEEAYATDPAWAAAEYGGEWRGDIESFVSRKAVEAVTDWGVYERPYVAGERYCGFVDPSGGSSDSMTLGVALPLRHVNRLGGRARPRQCGEPPQRQPKEEKAADKKLNTLAEGKVNRRATGRTASRAPARRAAASSATVKRKTGSAKRRASGGKKKTSRR